MIYLTDCSSFQGTDRRSSEAYKAEVIEAENVAGSLADSYNYNIDEEHGLAVAFVTGVPWAILIMCVALGASPRDGYDFKNRQDCLYCAHLNLFPCVRQSRILLIIYSPSSRGWCFSSVGCMRTACFIAFVMWLGWARGETGPGEVGPGVMQARCAMLSRVSTADVFMAD